MMPSLFCSLFNPKDALNGCCNRYFFWLDWRGRWWWRRHLFCCEDASSTGTLCCLICISVIMQALDLCYSDQVPYLQAD